jgi:hypothetical protein
LRAARSAESSSRSDKLEDLRSVGAQVGWSVDHDQLECTLDEKSRKKDGGSR